MNWMTSMWIPLYGGYSWTSHFKLQFIFVETTRRIDDWPRINSWSLWNSYSKWLKSWPRIRKKSTILHGYRRVHCVTTLLRLRKPKLMSSPTPCSVWEAWATNQPKLVRTKLNSVWKIAISKIWIEAMESRWYSSGKYPQDSLHWASSKRFKFLWQNCSVNMSSSKTGSYSCQCTMTLYGDLQETQRNVRKISESCELCSQKKWYGTYSDENKMEIGTRLLNKWWSTLQKAVILYFVPPAPWKEEN